RYCHIDNYRIMLIQTDGACLDNGGQGGRIPRAGAAFVYGPPKMADSGIKEITLEPENATSNRAELIAVIEALKYSKEWDIDCDKLVIATDSEYVVKGSTEWCREWAMRGWRTSSGEPVKNKDLWDSLIDEILGHKFCEVMFWKIPREWNSKADAAAKRAA
ncbi:ribonuclease H-like domain-containing protein, partial [Gymnopilus junonius]